MGIYVTFTLRASIEENVHFMWLSAMQKPDHNTLIVLEAKD